MSGRFASRFAHPYNELDTIPALGLCGGSALYLFAYVALRVRMSRTLSRGRLVAAVFCAYELIWWREARARTRASRVPASAS